LLLPSPSPWPSPPSLHEYPKVICAQMRSSWAFEGRDIVVGAFVRRFLSKFFLVLEPISSMAITVGSATTRERIDRIRESMRSWNSFSGNCRLLQTLAFSVLSIPGAFGSRVWLPVRCVSSIFTFFITVGVKREEANSHFRALRGRGVHFSAAVRLYAVLVISMRRERARLKANCSSSPTMSQWRLTKRT